MKILIDLVHFPNVNFFKNLINMLEKRGHNTLITTQKRGLLPQIVSKEFPAIKTIVFGKHRGTLFSLIFETNIFRFFKMFLIILKFKPNISLSVVSFPLEIAMGILRKPNIQICDDPERKHDFIIHKYFATQVLFPDIIEPRGKYFTFNALKEWAYLSPKYQKVDRKELEIYKLEEKNYIFIREVSTGSINYMNQNEGIVLSFSTQLPKNLKVILSLEDKTNIHQYPRDWIILKEPVNDILSLLFFSCVVISSGDSVAREGAMLGVPSIYCGIRDMKANQVLIEEKMLFKIPPLEVPAFVEQILRNELNLIPQNEFQNYLYNKWDDVNEYILNRIEKYNN